MFNFTQIWQYGGDWLGTVRRWVQFKKYNGNTVTWGSEEVLNPPMTIRQVEEVAKLAAVAAGNELLKKYKGVVLKHIHHAWVFVEDDDTYSSDVAQYNYLIDKLEEVIKQFDELSQ